MIFDKSDITKGRSRVRCALISEKLCARWRIRERLAARIGGASASVSVLACDGHAPVVAEIVADVTHAADPDLRQELHLYEEQSKRAILIQKEVKPRKASRGLGSSCENFGVGASE